MRVNVGAPAAAKVTALQLSRVVSRPLGIAFAWFSFRSTPETRKISPSIPTSEPATSSSWNAVYFAAGVVTRANLKLGTETSRPIPFEAVTVSSL